MSANDIRKSINIINESVNTQTVDEAAPMSLLKKLSTTMGSLFSDVKLGELKTGTAANKIYSVYQQYLGRIGVKPGEETVGDLYDFLKASNIKDDIIFKGMSQSLSTAITPVQIKDKTDLEHWYDTEIKTDYKNKIGKLFNGISAQAYKASITGSQAGAASSTTPPAPSPPASTTTASSSTGSSGLSDAELTSLIQSIKGSSAPISATELNTWRTQINAAGLHT